MLRFNKVKDHGKSVWFGPRCFQPSQWQCRWWQVGPEVLDPKYGSTQPPQKTHKFTLIETKHHPFLYGDYRIHRIILWCEPQKTHERPSHHRAARGEAAEPRAGGVIGGRHVVPGAPQMILGISFFYVKDMERNASFFFWCLFMTWETKNTNGWFWGMFGPDAYARSHAHGLG